MLLRVPGNRRTPQLLVLLALCGCDVFDARLDDPPTVSDAGGTSGMPAMDSAVASGGTNGGTGGGGTGGGGTSGGASGSGGMSGGAGAGGHVAIDGGLDSGSLDSGMDGSVVSDASLDASEAEPPEAEIDLCPNDPNKLEPGECGCGGDEALAASCAALRGALRHRYRFEGTGTSAVDSVGTANGEVMNAALDGSGALALAGGTSNQHVVLPPNIVSVLTNATFEVWLRWDGSATWERIFDFGASSGTSGTSYLFLTPRATSSSGFVRAAMSISGASNETRVEGSTSLSAGVLHHVAVVVDDDGDQLHLYIDGALQDSAALTLTLAGIDDQGNWLGRSHFSNDPELTGTLHEVRIYGAALSAAELASSAQLGPDPAFLD